MNLLGRGVLIGVMFHMIANRDLDAQLGRAGIDHRHRREKHPANEREVEEPPQQRTRPSLRMGVAARCSAQAQGW